MSDGEVCESIARMGTGIAHREHLPGGRDAPGWVVSQFD